MEHSPNGIQVEFIQGKISKLRSLALLAICFWFLFLAMIVTFSPAAYPVIFFVTGFVLVPLLVFIGYRISKYRRMLTYVNPAPQPVPVVVYGNPYQGPQNPVGSYPYYVETPPAYSTSKQF